MDPQEAPSGGDKGPPIEDLFDVLREGVARCRVIRNPQGQIVDYYITQANAAYLKSLGGKSAVGKRLSELRPDVSSQWYASFQPILAKGKRTRFEYEDRAIGRWFDIHVTPLSGDEMVQLYVDVTHRKQAEAHLAHLFNELNHRVKNNLMMVSAMLSMQARISKEPQVRHDLQQAIDRIQTISEVHAILYKTGAVEAVQFDTYLTELCQRLASGATNDRIAIEVEAEPLEVNSEDAVQMGIVVNELITNAVEYAYPSPAQGRILVNLAHRDDAIRLSVRDFGPGLPEGVDGSSGLGMRLVRSLVQKHGGSITMKSREGLEVQVTLPGGRNKGEGEDARLL